MFFTTSLSLGNHVLGIYTPYVWSEWRIGWYRNRRPNWNGIRIFRSGMPQKLVHHDATIDVIRFCRKVWFFEQNRKTGHHKFNDLQDSKFIKNKLCDRTQKTLV